MSLDLAKIIDLPKISDPRGNLTFLENSRHIPFDIKRVFFIYDIPSGQNRGAHAHHKLEQFIICLAGSLDVSLDDGVEHKTVHLNRPWMGLYVPPMVWASEGNFDPGTTYLVLASDFYDESDYFRDYDEFLKAVKP
jgi:dTDP-4-dehydrorhamnose 3,5-epimerase-like enzyme